MARPEPASLEEYKRRLQAHDWFYEYSDDQRVWSAGSSEQHSLESYRQKHDILATTWNSIAPKECQINMPIQKDIAEGSPAKQDMPAPQATVKPPRKIDFKP